jgi:hypothetical protein
MKLHSCREADYRNKWLALRLSVSELAICHQLSWRLDYFLMADNPTGMQTENSVKVAVSAAEKAVIRSP